MGYILFLIESRGKIEKLSHILGDNFKVMATCGHILDLDKKKMSVDFTDNFTPTYVPLPDKMDVIQSIKAAAKKADKVILASDEDREGEMISWSIVQVLDIKKPLRVTYNSVTKEEVLKAMKTPRDLDYNLIDAQKSRRILDRVVGYETTPIINKVFNMFGLSAGRVQSVVARLIIDKEAEIETFFSKEIPSAFKFSGDFKIKEPFNAILYHNGKMEKEKDVDEDVHDSHVGVVKISKEDSAKDMMNVFKKATFNVGDIIEKLTSRNPSAPFTTSTLQQEASRKLGMSISRTMSSAQRLYEAGYITYMRTDSTNLSKEALVNIGKYVETTYGKEYRDTAQYTSKSKNTQEAHEAVRPTDVNTVDNLKGKGIGNDEIRLYNMIWRRAVASQMSPAKIKRTLVQINISTTKNYIFVAETEVIVFDGFLKVYNLQNIEGDDESKTAMLSKLPKKGDLVDMLAISGTQSYQKPPARFNEASIISKLDPKNLNIGRPATYGPILAKIRERKYIEDGDNTGIEKSSTMFMMDSKRKLNSDTAIITLGKDTNKMRPTALGKLITNFLVENFSEFMDYKFTAQMEEQLDEIASGNATWIKVLKDFYKRFHPIIESIKEHSKELAKKNEKVIGIHPKFKSNIVAKFGRFGPYIEMKKDKINKKGNKAPIRAPLTIDTITLKDALELFEYPKNIGKYNEKDISLNNGEFGHYLKYDNIKVSIGEETEITLENAIEKIKEKLKANKEKYLWDGEDELKNYKVINGPYGIYVAVIPKSAKTGKKYNVKLPTDADVKTMTVDKIKEIINIQFSKKKRTFKKFAKKKP